MKRQVVTMLKGFGLTDSVITDRAHFSRDLGLDSLDMVDLVIQIEQAFGICIPDEDYDQLTCLQQVMQYLQTEQALA